MIILKRYCEINADIITVENIGRISELKNLHLNFPYKNTSVIQDKSRPFLKMMRLFACSLLSCSNLAPCYSQEK